MGAGPAHLVRAGAVDRLRAAGHRVRVDDVVAADVGLAAEIATAFELQRGVAAAVRRAVSAGAFPIVMSGNCNVAALGMLAGIASRDIGVCWFDAHGDFNTPETTVGGFLDGMALAMAAGRCWREMLAHLPGFAPVADESIVLIGARDLDPLEESLLTQSDVAVIRGDSSTAALHIEALSKRVADVYLHVDLDVLDPNQHGRANQFAAPNGLTLDEITAIVTLAGGKMQVRGASVTAYDPACDTDGRVCRAALQLLELLAAAPRPRDSAITPINARQGRGG